ncbi:MAG: hypothetical protein HXY46_07790 [Syntrophaceae bacterium]|nr:hypothetical protein [Syntrophaceae bacterium]
MTAEQLKEMAKALDGPRVVQKLCREKSQPTTARGYPLYTCNLCRAICPKGKGLGGS